MSKLRFLILLAMLCLVLIAYNPIRALDSSCLRANTFEANLSRSSVETAMSSTLTRLRLQALYNDISGNLLLAANLTDINGNPIPGESISFFVWGHAVGNRTTDPTGLALNDAIVLGWGGPYPSPVTVMARHYQNGSLYASEASVTLTYPKWQAIRIRNDGTVEPTTAPVRRIGNVYILTGNVTAGYNPINFRINGIIIERDDIILDGANFWIRSLPNINGQFGIILRDRSNVTVKNMRIQSFGVAICLDQCSNCTIARNGIIGFEYPSFLRERLATEECGVGIWIGTGNGIFENEISQTYMATMAFHSSNNTIYNNNVINSTYSDAGPPPFFYNWAVNGTYPIVGGIDFANDWDGGCIIGGNYWSNYTGQDYYSGLNQNEPGSDGIGDAPYIIDSNNTDRYPLMAPHQRLPNVAGVSAVGDPKPFVTKEGYCINFSLEVTNFDRLPETLDVTIRANSTIICRETLTEIMGKTRLIFSWSTDDFGFGNYSIAAIVEAIAGEQDTSDNTYPLGSVLVKGLGDCNGDGKVDIGDIVAVAVTFGFTTIDPRWNAQADVNADGVVDVFDLVIVALHYGDVR